jgi:hypothetical protein
VIVWGRLVNSAVIWFETFPWKLSPEEGKAHDVSCVSPCGSQPDRRDESPCQGEGTSLPLQRIEPDAAGTRYTG